MIHEGPKLKRKRPTSTGSSESVKEVVGLSKADIAAAVKAMKDKMQVKINALREDLVKNPKSWGGKVDNHPGYVTAAAAQKMVNDACAKIEADRKRNKKSLEDQIQAAIVADRIQRGVNVGLDIIPTKVYNFKHLLSKNM